MTEIDTYRKLYIEESRDNLQLLVRNLLALDSGAGPEVIDEIFRAAHTLKGMSASMGFCDMERLCHAMEDVFQLMRGGSLEPNQGLVDLLLACTDRIEGTLDDIDHGADGGSCCPDDLVNSLRQWKGEIHPKKILTEDIQCPPVHDANSPVMNEPHGSRYSLHIRISESCTMKDIRAMLALQNLEGLGRILSTTPSRNEIENGRCSGELSVLVESLAGMEALQAAASGVEINEVTITKVQGTEIPRVETDVSSVPSITSTQVQNQEKTREMKNIRVDIQRLDRMMNLVEDLVINRGRLKQIAIKHELKELDDSINMMGRSVSDLQNLMMNIRMIPLNHIFNRFPRVVRDVAHHDGKEVEFIIEGGETELDRSIMDGLSDPLLHLIRNAVNHGIESPDKRQSAGKSPKGVLRLRAHRDRDNVIIEIEDDGGGIDEKKVRMKAVERGICSEEEAKALSHDEVIQLLFRAGFSTADTVTDISGRGVGLDVVRSAIETLKGSIKVDTIPGQGTSFQLMLPPTMAIVEVIMVRISNRRCAIPIHNVVEVASLRTDLIHHVTGREVLMIRDEVLPLHRFDDMFGHREGKEIVIVVQNQQKKAGIAIDAVEGQQEVVIKPLNHLFGSCRGVGGVTIPGDGEVVPVLDITTLL